MRRFIILLVAVALSVDCKENDEHRNTTHFNENHIRSELNVTSKEDDTLQKNDTLPKDDETRPKRDLDLVKSLIMQKIFGPGVLVPILPFQNCSTPLVEVPQFPNIILNSPRIPLPGEVILPTEDIILPPVVNTILPSPDIIIPQTPNFILTPEKLAVPQAAIISPYNRIGKFNDSSVLHLNALSNSGVLKEQLSPPLSISPILVKPAEVAIDAVNVKCHGQNLCRPVSSVPIIPLVHRFYKPVTVQLPDLVFPTKYSYKQINHDGIMSYTASDSKNVVVTQSKVPVPIPRYINNRFEHILALSNKAMLVPGGSFRFPEPKPFIYTQKLHEIPNIPLPLNKVSSLEPTGYSYKHLNNDGGVTTFTGSGIVEEGPKPLVHFQELHKLPTVTQPLNVVSSVEPTGYSYKHVHNDGGVTTYSGSGIVEEGNHQKPLVIIKEEEKHLPLPGIFANRIENVAAIAHTFQRPHLDVIENHYYSAPSPIYSRPVVVNVDSKEYHAGGSLLPHGQHTLPSEIIHGDGVSTLSNTEVLNVDSEKVATQNVVNNESTKNLESTSVRNIYNKNELNLNQQNIDTRPAGFSYKTVHTDGSITDYLAPTHIQEHLTSVSQSPVFTNPINIPNEVYITNDNRIVSENLIRNPILSQYTYKQINHDKPNTFDAVINIEDIKLLNNAVDRIPHTHFVELNDDKRVASEYVYVPPALIPTNTIKPIVTETTQSSSEVSTKTNDEKVTARPALKRKIRKRVRTTTEPSVFVKNVTSITRSISSSRGSVDFKTARFSSAAKAPEKSFSTTETVLTSDTSFSANPIVVLPQDRVFSFKQINSDGSSSSVVSDDSKTVSVIEEKEKTNSRGDIPDVSY